MKYDDRYASAIKPNFILHPLCNGGCRAVSLWLDGPAAIAFWCIVLGLGVIVASPRGLRREHLPLLGLAVIVILAYAFVLHEQLAARPWIASPHPLWREAAETLGIPIAPSVSIARNEPFFALGAPLANMLAVICSFIVCIDRDRARQLILVIAWSGVAYAIYGIAAY